jgi:hypothetical protein
MEVEEESNFRMDQIDLFFENVIVDQINNQINYEKAIADFISEQLEKDHAFLSAIIKNRLKERILEDKIDFEEALKESESFNDFMAPLVANITSPTTEVKTTPNNIRNDDNVQKILAYSSSQFKRLNDWIQVINKRYEQDLTCIGYSSFASDLLLKRDEDLMMVKERIKADVHFFSELLAFFSTADAFEFFISNMKRMRFN